MPIFALAFGSFGDFVTVLQLALALRAQLADAASGSQQIRELIADINIFRRAVQQIQETVNRRRSALQPDVLNGIEYALAAVKDVLLGVDRRTRAHQQKITRAEGQAAWRRLWRIAAWSFLGGNREVEALRARMRDHVTAMLTFLSLSQSDDHDAVLHRLDEQHTTLDRLSAVVNAIHEHFGVDTPTFQFRDEWTGNFYPPCGRTSLQRLHDLRKVLITMWEWGFDAGKGFMPMQRYLASEYTGQSFQKTFWMHTSVRTPLGLDCFFFKSDFGQWQVLVAVSPYTDNGEKIPERDHKVLQRALAPLLDQKHLSLTSCDCHGPLCQSLSQHHESPTQRGLGEPTMRILLCLAYMARWQRVGEIWDMLRNSVLRDQYRPAVLRGRKC